MCVRGAWAACASAGGLTEDRDRSFRGRVWDRGGGSGYQRLVDGPAREGRRDYVPVDESEN